jgi:hypothetical protein
MGKSIGLTLDIAFLTLFALQMLMEECWKKNILLVGVTKDTAARDSSGSCFQSWTAEAC